MIAASIGTIDSVYHPPAGSNIIVTDGNSSRAYIWYTQDATTWTNVAFLTEPGVYPLTDSVWSSYFNKFFVCAEQSSSKPGWSSSSDAITWTDSATVTTRNWELITQFGTGGSTKLCTLASNFSALSTDGSTWTEYASGPVLPNSMVWAAALGKLVVPTGDSTYTSYTSTNGYTWTGSNSLPYKVDGYKSVAWSTSLGLLVTVKASTVVGTCIYTSTDGITWTARTATLAKKWKSVAWSPTLGMFIIVGKDTDDSATTQYMYSYNGITWYTGAIDNQVWNLVIWSDSLKSFVAKSGIIVAQSVDGLTWTYSSVSIGSTSMSSK